MRCRWPGRTARPCAATLTAPRCLRMILYRVTRSSRVHKGVQRIHRQQYVALQQSQVPGSWQPCSEGDMTAPKSAPMRPYIDRQALALL